MEQVLEAPASRFNAGLRSSATPEWDSPAHILDRGRALLGGFDLDPASNAVAQETVKARAWFGLDHPDLARRDGLAAPWNGRVWMNPPYGRVIGAWVEKLRAEAAAGRVTRALVLLPARTDTQWFKPLRQACALCFVDGRLVFSGAENSAPFPSVLVYVGPSGGWRGFAHAFDSIGDVVVPLRSVRVWR